MISRVPASLALLALRQSGYHLSAATLRSWVHRGHITRKGTGYDLTEIRLYLEQRDHPRVSLTRRSEACNAI